jgi:hypothetical protein
MIIEKQFPVLCTIFFPTAGRAENIGIAPAVILAAVLDFF